MSLEEEFERLKKEIEELTRLAGKGDKELIARLENIRKRLMDLLSKINKSLIYGLVTLGRLEGFIEELKRRENKV